MQNKDLGKAPTAVKLKTQTYQIQLKATHCLYVLSYRKCQLL